MVTPLILLLFASLSLLNIDCCLCHVTMGFLSFYCLFKLLVDCVVSCEKTQIFIIYEVVAVSRLSSRSSYVLHSIDLRPKDSTFYCRDTCLSMLIAVAFVKATTACISTN